MTTNFEQHKAELLKNPKFKKAYEELGPVFDVICQLTVYRISQGITQQELARRIGTKQSSISRFESSMKMPSVSFLKSIADALGFRLQIKLDPKTA